MLRISIVLCFFLVLAVSLAGKRDFLFETLEFYDYNSFYLFQTLPTVKLTLQKISTATATAAIVKPVTRAVALRD